MRNNHAIRSNDFIFRPSAISAALEGKVENKPFFVKEPKILSIRKDGSRKVIEARA